ncbi:MAG TPA: CinA family protein [Actinocrinis sp.]|nr:CinA family protein [Actinocrinis sp.]
MTSAHPAPGSTPGASEPLAFGPVSPGSSAAEPADSTPDAAAAAAETTAQPTPRTAARPEDQPTGPTSAASPLTTAAAEVLRLATAAGLTLAVAESLTGGRLAAALTWPAGASRAFRGSVTAYATELKAAVLGVDPDLLARVGAVDAEVARQMAAGVRALCGSDLALATTGVAGPTPQDGRPVGTVYIALADHQGAEAALFRFSGTRSSIQDATVAAALNLMVNHLNS